MKIINVLIVDDSLLIRKMFTEILSSDPEIRVVGTAYDPIDAREKIKKLNPDVITLDIEMPNMDGLSFLEKIMNLRPMPVVMVSSLTQKGAQETFKALELGAVDYVSKTSSTNFDIDKMGSELITKVKSAARARVRIRPANSDKNKILQSPAAYKPNIIVALGASTGGVEAIREIVSCLPSDCPPIIITQHMPPTFTKTFATRLNGISAPTICEAHDGQKIERGNIYISPGDHHLEIKLVAGCYYITLNNSLGNVSGHCPSVDVMFDSVANVTKNNAVGVILTGMGKDGAKGMLRMKKSGCYNLGQSEDSCVVYGMPKAAYMAGAVDKQIALKNVAEEILKACS